MSDLKCNEYNLPNIGPREFLFRDTDADKGVVEQIFGQGDYSLDNIPRGKEIFEMYEAIVDRGKIPLIIDAGANIGASVVYFQAFFPKSHVVAFEPELENFNLMKRNTKGLNVDIRLAAIGAKAGRVKISNPSAEAWGYMTQADSTGDCVMASLSKVIKEKTNRGCELFMVKVDIEGGEADLFSRNTGWIKQTPLLIIELHDWLLPKKGTSQNFLRVIANEDRDFVQMRENIFSIANKPVQSNPSPLSRLTGFMRGF